MKNNFLKIKQYRYLFYLNVKLLGLLLGCGGGLLLVGLEAGEAHQPLQVGVHLGPVPKDKVLIYLLFLWRGTL
jgi:hypothetical protein